MSVFTILVYAGLAYVVFKLAKLIYGEVTSPLRVLPGPPNLSFILGNFRGIANVEYTKMIKIYFFFSGYTIYFSDSKAINHILMNYYDYQKPQAAIYNIKQLMGPGICPNPVFGPSHIRELTEIFVEKSLQLRDMWTKDISISGGLTRMTLDVIGLAGFNDNFNALSDGQEEDELSSAFSIIFKAGTSLNPISLFRNLFPPLRVLVNDFTRADAEVKSASEIMKRIGGQLLKENRESISSSGKNKDIRGSRDVLSLLVHANVAPHLEDHRRLSDEHVLVQVPTFLVAGHETTNFSTGVTWVLYALAQNIAAQTKLRQELLTASTDNPTMEELNSFPYLDAIVRETMRLYAPVPMTSCVAMKDDAIPLEMPFRGLDENTLIHNFYRINKGQGVTIPILPLNRSRMLWGEDSMQFKSERWFPAVPEAATNIPGVFGNMLTFLGGPRSCIGYRFSLVEMKALLFTLLGAPAKDISQKTSLTARPVLITDLDNPNQMPLLIRPVTTSV
ncbi:cytochrome P450 [Crucibulum laeve]|uniref:Cytochrome P450 n=1 Tax=Crucibulum laeve TaxID=68775 RepID=A0A5C3LY80_9AGAR|nr:cytochrome P450 [Crucibulum laeve]